MTEEEEAEEKEEEAEEKEEEERGCVTSALARGPRCGGFFFAIS